MIAAAVVVVLVAIIAVVVATSGGDDTQADSTGSASASRSGSTSTSQSPSVSVPPSTPASPTIATEFRNYSQFSELVGTGPGVRESAFRGAKCEQAGPAEGIAGMLDQITCTDLAGSSPVTFAVGRFSSKGAVDNFVANLRKDKYTYGGWKRDGEIRRGYVLRSPAGRGPDVVNTFCGLPTYLVDFSADKDSKLTSEQILNDYWSRAKLGDDTPAAC